MATTPSLPRRPNGRYSAVGEGIWTREEHTRFLRALETYPNGPWKRVSELVGTRNARQTMTHAQKYKQKLARHERGLRSRKKLGLTTTAPTQTTTKTSAAALAPTSRERTRRKVKVTRPSTPTTSSRRPVPPTGAESTLTPGSSIEELSFTASLLQTQEEAATTPVASTTTTLAPPEWDAAAPPEPGSLLTSPVDVALGLTRPLSSSLLRAPQPPLASAHVPYSSSAHPYLHSPFQPLHAPPAHVSAFPPCDPQAIYLPNLPPKSLISMVPPHVLSFDGGILEPIPLQASTTLTTSTTGGGDADPRWMDDYIELLVEAAV